MWCRRTLPRVPRERQLCLCQVHSMKQPQIRTDSGWDELPPVAGPGCTGNCRTLAQALGTWLRGRTLVATAPGYPSLASLLIPQVKYFAEGPSAYRLTKKPPASLHENLKCLISSNQHFAIKTKTKTKQA